MDGPKTKADIAKVWKEKKWRSGRNYKDDCSCVFLPISWFSEKIRKSCVCVQKHNFYLNKDSNKVVGGHPVASAPALPQQATHMTDARREPGRYKRAQIDVVATDPGNT